MDQEKWDHRFLELAAFVSTWSKDPSTQVGAVLANGKKILSVGYNGFPSRIPDDPLLLQDRPRKYELVTHAELNTFLNFGGTIPNGSSLYTFPLFPCPDCARFIIATPISRCVFRLGNSNSRFLDTLEVSRRVLTVGGVELVQYES